MTGVQTCALPISIEARNSLSLDAVLKQLNQLRSEVGNVSSGSSVSPVQSPRPAPAATPQAPAFALHDAAAPLAAPKPATSAAPSVAAPAPVHTAPVAAGDLPDLWSRLVEAVGRASSFTRSYLLNAHPVSFEKNVFVIGFDPEFADHLGLVDNSRNHTLLATKLAELGHAHALIKFIKAETPVGWSQPVTAPTPAPVAAKIAPTVDRKSTRLNSSHLRLSRMPSSA